MHKYWDVDMKNQALEMALAPRITCPKWKIRHMINECTNDCKR